MPATPSRRAAIALMLLAVALFAFMDAGLKLLSARYPPLQVAALRGLSSLPLVLVWAVASAPLRSLCRVHWPLHLLRGILSVAMMVGFVYGISRLPMTTTYAITFVAPLLVTAMAGPLLGEKVGLGRWIAIGIGVLGMLVVLRPTGEGMLTLAGLSVLLGAACYAGNVITVRMLAQRDSTQAMVLWMLVLLSLGASLLAWPSWQPLQWRDGWIIAAVGLCGTLAQVALTEAFRRGEASLIAPLEYTALVWVAMLDVALWGVLPAAPTWVGAAIIVASGLYLLTRERVHAEAEHP
ncbi:DMT family transporter [Pseudoxanthomonas helianthi]|uniref:DMT family transporter n=1 Tax=Pseudoxanthomonas helianthi TaxID=1453541 RepID=A0A941ASM8_9GAMM|nr:DMT family transporter [Pseudoxanthomonas helianthi]MBP3983565.1 DMT family transporter [Pseudoxanthomonas helianthi]